MPQGIKTYIVSQLKKQKKTMYNDNVAGLSKSCCCSVVYVDVVVTIEQFTLRLTVRIFIYFLVQIFSLVLECLLFNWEGQVQSSAGANSMENDFQMFPYSCYIGFPFL